LPVGSLNIYSWPGDSQGGRPSALCTTGKTSPWPREPTAGQREGRALRSRDVPAAAPFPLPSCYLWTLFTPALNFDSLKSKQAKPNPQPLKTALEFQVC